MAARFVVTPDFRRICCTWSLALAFVAVAAAVATVGCGDAVAPDADIPAGDIPDVHECNPSPADLRIPDCGHEIALPAGGLVHETCVIVPAGRCHTFWMGSVENEYYSLPAEFPRHRVDLTGYSISRFPVTVAEYKACVDARMCPDPLDNMCLAEPGAENLTLATPNIADIEGKHDHPVNCVGHGDATAFCTWLGGELPTEARYEYAAGGPMLDAEQVVLFPWGDNHDECHVNILGADPFDETSPVGFFNGTLRARAEGRWAFGPDEYQTCDDRSPFGLHDINHNVMEIVKDGPSDYANWTDGAKDPEAPGECVGIATRNSSWRYEDIHHARVTNRHRMCMDPENLPDGVPYNKNVLRSNDIGFRCAFGATLP